MNEYMYAGKYVCLYINRYVCMCVSAHVYFCACVKPNTFPPHKLKAEAGDSVFFFGRGTVSCCFISPHLANFFYIFKPVTISSHIYYRPSFATFIHTHTFTHTYMHTHAHTHAQRNTHIHTPVHTPVHTHLHTRTLRSHTFRQ